MTYISSDDMNPPSTSAATNRKMANLKNGPNPSDIEKGTAIPKDATPHRTMKNPTRTTKTNTKLVVFPDGDAKMTSPSLIPPAQPGPSTISPSHSELGDVPLTLKRVTAYCTSDSYNLDRIRFFLSDIISEEKDYEEEQKNKIYRIDEVLCVSPSANLFANIMKKKGINAKNKEKYFRSNAVTSGDDSKFLCIFDYGVFVAWGLTQGLEEYLIYELLKDFSTNHLRPDDIEVEVLQYCMDKNATARVVGDVIVMRQEDEFAKLTISHALAQSVKLSVFEERLEEAIESTKNIPYLLAKTGKVSLTKTQINKKIGELFVRRIQLNLVSNVLDTPDIFWSEVEWEGLYKASRGTHQPRKNT